MIFFEQNNCQADCCLLPPFHTEIVEKWKEIFFEYPLFIFLTIVVQCGMHIKVQN